MDRPRTSRSGQSHRAQVLLFVAAFHEEHGIAPTLREVAAGIGTDLSTAAYHVRLLVQQGWLQQRPRSPRSLRVVEMHSRESPG